MKINIKKLLLSIAIITPTNSILANYDFETQQFNHARVMIELNGKTQEKLKEDVKFKSSNTKLLPALSLQHLKDVLGDQYNKNLDLQENVKKAFSLPHFQNMLYEIPVMKASEFSKGENLTSQDKDHLIKEVTKMIQEETKHEGAYAIYSAVNSHYAAFQDLFKKLNEILREKYVDSSFRFGIEDFKKVKDFEEFKRKILADPEHDNTWLFKILGVCGSLSPLQTSSTESSMYFWSHNYNISETDLLPFILKSLNIKEDTINQFAGSMKNIIDMSWNLGSRMKQIFMNADNLDHYTWLSGRNGYEFSSVNLLPNGKIESTSIPSQALSFYRQSPENFIKHHRENFNKHVAPALGNRLNNAIDKDDLSQSTFGRRRNDNYHIGQLQFRLFLSPDLMNSDDILIKEYYSQNNSSNILKKYNLAIEKLAIQIINSATKCNEKSNEIKNSAFYKSIEVAKKSKAIANVNAEKLVRQQAEKLGREQEQAKRLKNKRLAEQARQQEEARRQYENSWTNFTKKTVSSSFKYIGKKMWNFKVTPIV